DAAMPTGFRIEVPEGAKLRAASGADADVHGWYHADGFSTLALIVATLGQPVTADGFVGVLDDPDTSTKAASPTLVIDADSGQLVPHFADLDPRASDVTRQAIVIHPIAGLAPRTRYVVALHGMRSADGAPARAPEGFRRLRDHAADGSLAPLID